MGIFVALLTNFLFKDFGDDSWRWMLGVMVVPAAVFALLVRRIPESPRWLILNDRESEAIPILGRIGNTDAAGTIADIRSSVSHHSERLFQKKFIRPISYAVLLAMFNQLSGINAIFYYAPRIFEMAGFDKAHSFLQPVYIGAANLVFTLLAMTMIDRFGRKKLLLIGSVGMILFLALTASALMVSTGQSNGMVVVYLIGFIAFFAFSQGAVVWVFISEIFPNSVRSQGGSLGSFTHWIMAAIISWVFPYVASILKGNIHIGVVYAFVFFALMMVVHLFFVWKVLPETKGKSLEHIQQQLGIE